LSGREWVGSGRTVEEAVSAGLRALGVGPERVDVEVLSEPARGLRVLWGRQPARVRLRVRPGRGETALAFVEGVLGRLGVGAEARLEDGPEAVQIRLASPEASLLIGRRGQTLEALQVLTEAAAARASRSDEDRRPIVVDVEDYRVRRRRALEQLARRMARHARRTGRQVALDPMPAHERRIVHLALRGEQGVTTQSEGEEPHRRVVIRPVS
jgi:spoIIIJ-associated protein